MGREAWNRVRLKAAVPSICRFLYLHCIIAQQVLQHPDGNHELCIQLCSECAHTYLRCEEEPAPVSDPGGRLVGASHPGELVVGAFSVKRAVRTSNSSDRHIKSLS